MDTKAIDTTIDNLKNLQFQKVIESLQAVKLALSDKDKIINDVTLDREKLNKEHILTIEKLNKELHDCKNDLATHKSLVGTLKNLLK